MKTFKAYIKKEYPHINSGDEMFAWDIWKAALEWVLINCNTNWDEYDRPTGFFEIDDDVIKNELGD